MNKKYEEKTLEEKNKKKKNKTEKQKIFIQPRMRFKPRNELERIIEVMDLLGKGINSQKLKKILVQLNHTDFDKVWADSDRDYWMTAEEAKEYGMIDEVLVRKNKA